MLVPKIVTLKPKILVGINQQMSLTNNATAQLWQKFIPMPKLVKHTVDNDLYSLQQYNGVLSLSTFSPDNTFTKWAAVEVEQGNDIPENMEALHLERGLYAGFLYKIMQQHSYIFSVHGFRNRSMKWMNYHISKYWVKNTAIPFLIRKQKFGYL
jgi:AraC family transcriptional regulator